MILPSSMIQTEMGWVVEGDESETAKKREKGRKKNNKAEVAGDHRLRFKDANWPDPAFPWWSRWEERARLEEYNARERERAMVWFLYGIVLDEKDYYSRDSEDQIDM